ncbi:nucleotidyl transferase AbiEii/AbiGii toxin family protein [Candidatus Woesebacteria bacterium]|nr:nucleotidyl transferase AbiEii/AbiGii toxin family protein [Candidatus Woesebacteria bacterium]
MGQDVLTPNQHFILDLASKEKIISEWFYFTGGTALAEFYLKHRLSEDLDFFSDTSFDHSIVDDFLNKIASKKNATFTKKIILGPAIAQLVFPNNH